MGTKIFKCLIAGAFTLLSFMNVNASDYVYRVIIVNEGYNDFMTGEQLVPVSVGVYDPATKTYTEVFTINDERFVSHAIIHEDFLYIAADKSLLKYDRYTLQQVAVQNVPGIRNIAVWNDKLIVTRGEVGGLPSYLQVYHADDLSFDYELTPSNGPEFATQNIEVIGDKAYFVINNGYEWGNPKGLIGVLDLLTQSYTEFDLGPDGKNPDNLMRDGNQLYTLNNKDFTGSSVSVFNLDDNTSSTTNLSHVTTGCGTSALFTTNVWYQQNGSQKLHQFNPANLSVVDSIEFGKSFYGLAVDPVSNLMYATITDYVSSGMAFIYDASGLALDSFAVGVSAGNIVFDVRKTTSTQALQQAQFEVKTFPTPAANVVFFSVKNFVPNTLELYDLNGRLLNVSGVNNPEQISMKVNGLSAGLYQVVLKDQSGNAARARFVKQ